MSVRVGESWSAPRPVHGGVPQGSILGVFLFNAATDDLGEEEEVLQQASDTDEEISTQPSNDGGGFGWVEASSGSEDTSLGEAAAVTSTPLAGVEDYAEGDFSPITGRPGSGLLPERSNHRRALRAATRRIVYSSEDCLLYTSPSPRD